MDPFILGGLATGIIGGIGKMFGRGAANRKMEALIKSDPVYNKNPIAAQRYGLAKTMLNSRAPGSMAAEKNVYRNQANQLGRLQRNATDSSQLLALGATAQGQSNQAFEDLATQDANDYQRRYQNYVNAGDTQIQEGDKAFQDETRRWNDKAQLQGAQNANKQNTWGDISNLGFGAASFGMQGGFNNLFGGGGSNNAYQMPRMIANPQLLPYGN